MTKFKKVVIEEVEEIFEEDIIPEQTEETEPIAEAPVRREWTPEEEAEMRTIKEERYRRFAQLAGLADQNEPMNEATSKKVIVPKIKLALLSEGLREDVKQLMRDGKKKMSQFPENIRKMISEEMSAIEEFGMPAMQSEPNPYRALDSFAASLSMSVKNAITKHLGLNSNDPDMPNKANYIIDVLVKRLKNPIQE
jgi:hypothetical protein